jgi:hypothetical protein
VLQISIRHLLQTLLSPRVNPSKKESELVSHVAFLSRRASLVPNL